MAAITQQLGYGRTGTVTADFFTRILKGEVYDTEEARYDKSTVLGILYAFCAIAPAGSPTSDLIWQCVRWTYTNGMKTRCQFQGNISWDNRSNGWN